MTTPTDPTTLRTALEALVAKWDDEAPRIPDRRGSIVLTSAAHELRSLLETHRTTLATPAPAADEARVTRLEPMYVVGFDSASGLDTTVVARRHPDGTVEIESVDRTPAPPTPPATEERTVADCDDHHVSGMLGFCPKCGLGDATEDYPVTPPAHVHEWHYYDGNETEGTEYRCRCGAMTDDQPAPTPAPPTPSPEGAGMTGCVDPKAHRKSWRVTHRRHNHSAFNGYHWTFSAYSEVECPTCMNSVGWPRAYGSWRTRAAYVADLPGDCTR